MAQLRERIAVLGRATVDHRTFAPEGRLYMTEPVPVLLPGGSVVAYVERLKVRGADVWGLGEWLDGHGRPSGHVLSPAFVLNDYNVRGSDTIVLDAELVSCTVLSWSSWPWKE